MQFLKPIDKDLFAGFLKLLLERDDVVLSCEVLNHVHMTDLAFVSNYSLIKQVREAIISDKV